jgi:putative ABC transport system permease protein
MRSLDFIYLSTQALNAARMRSALTALSIAIGVAAVVLLTAIGSGIQAFILHEFTQFGTHLISINPGKSTTVGASLGVFGNTRPLTLNDADALRQLPQVLAVEAIVAGNAVAQGNGRQRRVMVYGSGAHLPQMFQFSVAQGRYLPPDDARGARAYAVLGAKLQQELFGDSNPLGQRLRVGGQRYRIIGVMEAKGQLLGFDLDDTVYIPVGKAMELFNREGLMEIDVLYRPGSDEAALVENIRQVLRDRHGREDFTIITQQQMMGTLDAVLGVLTFAVAALGGISLLVGAVGIFTIMTIAVHERSAEVGLLRALGASRTHVLGLFLGEAVLLSTLGGLIGLLAGLGIAALLSLLIPALPVAVNWLYLGAAEAGAALIGVIAGLLPAFHAATLAPIETLRAE